MRKIESKLTVFFADPFWVGVCERITDGKLEVCKFTFGPEPKDYEVYEYLLENWTRLRYSPPVSVEAKMKSKANPKRIQRQIKKQLKPAGIGTKAQQAVKLQQAEGKAAGRKRSRCKRDEEKERLFAIKQEKKKQKHRGH